VPKLVASQQQMREEVFGQLHLLFTLKPSLSGTHVPLGKHENLELSKGDHKCFFKATLQFVIVLQIRLFDLLDNVSGEYIILKESKLKVFTLEKIFVAAGVIRVLLVFHS